MLDFTPNPILIQIGPLPVYWYGIGYALGLGAAYLVMAWLARRAGEDPEILGNAMIVVALAALIGGRAYHVIDQWALYKDHPLTAFLPLTVQPDGSYAFSGFTGLGVPGGIITGTIAAWVYVRRTHQEFWRWADVVAPALFVMQAIGRWGNFFNQELYGPPTTLPWGLKVYEWDQQAGQAVRDAAGEPVVSGIFQPTFLYEAIFVLLLALLIVVLDRRHSFRPGQVFALYIAGYPVGRFVIELMRTDEANRILGLRVNVWVSILVFALGAFLYVHFGRRRAEPDIDTSEPLEKVPTSQDVE